MNRLPIKIERAIKFLEKNLISLFSYNFEILSWQDNH
jgi:hypothetical protein